jgi:hypothetical protein
LEGGGITGRGKRAIKGETQSISADFQFPGPATYFSKQSLLSLCANKENLALTLPVFQAFNSSKSFRKTRTHSVQAPLTFHQSQKESGEH